MPGRGVCQRFAALEGNLGWERGQGATTSPPKNHLSPPSHQVHKQPRRAGLLHLIPSISVSTSRSEHPPVCSGLRHHENLCATAAQSPVAV